VHSVAIAWGCACNVDSGDECECLADNTWTRRSRGAVPDSPPVASVPVIGDLSRRDLNSLYSQILLD
jgi:hypothetical protein